TGSLISSVHGEDGGQRSPLSTRFTDQGDQMLQRVIDDFKISTGLALRQTSLAAMAAICLFITTSFLCAAAFIAVLNKYGPVEACFAGAAIFFAVTLIAAGTYLVRKRLAQKRVAARAKAAAPSLLADPMMVATALQIVR